MTRKRHNHTTHSKPTPSTVRKRHRTPTATQHQEDIQSKATRFLFLSEMLAALEMAPNTAQQNKDQTPNCHKGSNYKQ